MTPFGEGAGGRRPRGIRRVARPDRMRKHNPSPLAVLESHGRWEGKKRRAKIEKLEVKHTDTSKVRGRRGRAAPTGLGGRDVFHPRSVIQCYAPETPQMCVGGFEFPRRPLPE